MFAAAKVNYSPNLCRECAQSFMEEEAHCNCPDLYVAIYFVFLSTFNEITSLLADLKERN